MNFPVDILTDLRYYVWVVRKYATEDEMTKLLNEGSKQVPVRLEIVKNEDGNRFHGNLVWADGTVWYAWQSFKRMKDVIQNARCTFSGPIVRV